MRKERWIWLAALALILSLCALFSSCEKPVVKVKRSLIDYPAIVMDKKYSTSVGLFVGPIDTTYYLTLYIDGKSFPVETSDKIYYKYSKGDTISKEAVLTEYHYYK